MEFQHSNSTTIVCLSTEATPVISCYQIVAQPQQMMLCTYPDQTGSCLVNCQLEKGVLNSNQNNSRTDMFNLGQAGGSFTPNQYHFRETTEMIVQNQYSCGIPMQNQYATSHTSGTSMQNQYTISGTNDVPVLQYGPRQNQYSLVQNGSLSQNPYAVNQNGTAPILNQYGGGIQTQNQYPMVQNSNIQLQNQFFDSRNLTNGTQFGNNRVELCGSSNTTVRPFCNNQVTTVPVFYNQSVQNNGSNWYQTTPQNSGVIVPSQNCVPVIQQNTITLPTQQNFVSPITNNISAGVNQGMLIPQPFSRRNDVLASRKRPRKNITKTKKGKENQRSKSVSNNVTTASTDGLDDRHILKELYERSPSKTPDILNTGPEKQNGSNELQPSNKNQMMLKEKLDEWKLQKAKPSQNSDDIGNGCPREENVVRETSIEQPENGDFESSSYNDDQRDVTASEKEAVTTDTALRKRSRESEESERDGCKKLCKDNETSGSSGIKDGEISLDCKNGESKKTKNDEMTASKNPSTLKKGKGYNKSRVMLCKRSHFLINFHKVELICMTKYQGKYVLMREFLQKCFPEDKQKMVYKMKVEMQIPFIALADEEKDQVVDYMKHKGLIASENVKYIGLIDVFKASELYKRFYDENRQSTSLVVQDTPKTGTDSTFKSATNVLKSPDDGYESSVSPEDDNLKKREETHRNESEVDQVDDEAPPGDPVSFKDVSEEDFLNGGILELLDKLYRYIEIYDERFLPMKDLLKIFDEAEISRSIRNGNINVFQCSDLEAGFLTDFRDFEAVSAGDDIVNDRILLHICRDTKKYQKKYKKPGVSQGDVG